MEKLNDKVAVVTGAGSGIGRALSIALAEQGCGLAISDVDQIGLEQTGEMAEALGARVSTHLVDVSDRDQMQWYAEEAVDRHGGVDLVINNAGVTLVSALESVEYEDFEWLMGINFWGVVHGTKTFLPYLRQRPEAHIVNISSINSVLTFPYNGPYCAAKWAVTGFTETLAQEMAGTTIRVSCVQPGGVKTNVVASARFRIPAGFNKTHEQMTAGFDEAARTTPEKAARIIIHGIRKNKARILVGPDARVMDWLKRLFPTWWPRYVGKKVIES